MPFKKSKGARVFFGVKRMRVETKEVSLFGSCTRKGGVLNCGIKLGNSN